MWQFAMNTPANGNGPAACAGENGGARIIKRLPALACFTLITALHLVLLSVFNFSAGREKIFTETAELFLTLDFPDSGPEELGELTAGAFPEIPLSAEIALPATETAPIAEAAMPVAELVESVESPVFPEETAMPAMDAAAFPPAFAGDAAANVGNVGGSGFAGAASTRKTPMTEAEYLALIIGRLEKNKIYPLSVRKRGIEGDITAAFTIRRDGSVSELTLADPPGHRFLAQAAFETIRSASPFPVMEGREGDYTVQVSIRYRLEDESPQGP